MNPEIDLERLGRDLLRGYRPPAMPPGLRERSLTAARREYRRPADSWISQWIDTVFRSRLLWGTWAVAVLLAILALPDPTPLTTDLPSVSDSALRDNDPLGDPQHRPRPNGPTLAEALLIDSTDPSSPAPSWRQP